MWVTALLKGLGLTGLASASSEKAELVFICVQVRSSEEACQTDGGSRAPYITTLRQEKGAKVREIQTGA